MTHLCYAQSWFAAAQDDERHGTFDTRILRIRSVLLFGQVDLAYNQDWEDNMKRPFMTIACIAALCGPASAKDFKFDQVSCYSGPAHVIQHADGIIAGSYDGTGMLRGDEGTPFSMLSGRA